MSVLFMPAVVTLIKTSVGSSFGTERSVLYCNFSGPPCPVRTTPDIALGISGCDNGAMVYWVLKVDMIGSMKDKELD